MVARVKIKLKPAKPEKIQTYPGARRGPKSTYQVAFAKAAGVLCSRHPNIALLRVDDNGTGQVLYGCTDLTE